VSDRGGLQGSAVEPSLLRGALSSPLVQTSIERVAAMLDAAAAEIAEREPQDSTPRERQVARPIDATLRGRIAADYKAGASTRALAARYGIGKTTVLKALQRERVAMRPPAIYARHQSKQGRSEGN
jgi:DNA invertase Pin-like site-specific DNA recombinase